jgi:hypothetical protein
MADMRRYAKNLASHTVARGIIGSVMGPTMRHCDCGCSGPVGPTEPPNSGHNNTQLSPPHSSMKGRRGIPATCMSCADLSAGTSTIFGSERRGRCLSSIHQSATCCEPPCKPCYNPVSILICVCRIHRPHDAWYLG